MPRQNQARVIASEHALARRIAYEREKRGWSYEGLASRMTQAGCAINQSALHKIEKSDPPRRITVDELVALSRVFGVGVAELLDPPELLANAELRRLLSQMREDAERLLLANGVYRMSLQELASFIADSPLADSAVEVVGRDVLDDIVERLRSVDDDATQAHADRLERIPQHGQ